MDSQDMLLWGERKTDKVFSEEERLAQLCQWGKEFGLDGFVRYDAMLPLIRILNHLTLTIGWR
jgi:hypothetical protein